ncbi:MAG: xanthine dehydrogenase family protein molybdopterin-binding subunit [Acidobacteria bacterium]|nr:xanthine dehydrogenase family protein molybdopterin-binding subunit [Acidobacteriota bacterium]
MKTNIIGKPIDRVDARLKVTGAAKYAAEFPQKNLAYAFPVRSTIGKGAITTIDTGAAEKSAGVIAILTHKNAPRLKPADIKEVGLYGTLPGETLLPLQDGKIFYVGQYVGLVVAETYEQARAAAGLVKVSYREAKPETRLVENETKGARKARSSKPKTMFVFLEAQPKRGNAAAAFKTARVKFDQTYSTPTEHHHPMELHASIAVWEGADKLTVFDATQAVMGTNVVLAQTFGLDKKNVRIISPFVGGGFGCKGLIWAHTMLAAMAAQAVKRPVKLVLTRQMMQTNVGHRGETMQNIRFGANKTGKFSAITHDTTTYTSDGIMEYFFEPCGLATQMLYSSPNVEIIHNVVPLNFGSPTPMRAPGESSGTFALESAMDELAFELKIDPVRLRLTNYANTDEQKKLPFSSKKLKECYALGAEKFGWTKRIQTPRQMRDGRWLIGYGMATATYPGYRGSASVRVRVNADGTALVQSATQDIGTGTYTVMAQTASEFLGIPVERIKVEIGDSDLPPAGTSGGSQSLASVAPAIEAACKIIVKRAMETVSKDKQSPLFGKTLKDVSFGDGRMFLTTDSSKGETYIELMKRANLSKIEECVTANLAGQPPGASGAPCSPFTANPDQNADLQKYSFHSFGAQFAEVGVDEDLGIVRVRRFVSVLDIGRVVNEKTARSQVFGGVNMGIGMALMEETHYDPRNARPVVRTLADYHVPVHADIPPQFEVYFINEPDPHLNSLGIRGVGEIGITGVAAAIANAVFNATGKRVRDLPITPDKLL